MSDSAGPHGREPTVTVQRLVHHFSDDGSIERFVPRPAPSDPGEPAGVRAVGPEHADVYWFPRQCPRVAVWAATPSQRELLHDRFGTDADRICSVESAWLDRIRTTHLYRYDFELLRFRPERQPGHFVAIEPVEPVAVVRLDDLLGMHAAAGVELRLAPRLGRFVDVVLESGLPHHIVRLRDVRR